MGSKLTVSESDIITSQLAQPVNMIEAKRYYVKYDTDSKPITAFMKSKSDIQLNDSYFKSILIASRSE